MRSWGVNWMLQYLDNKLPKNPCSDSPETRPPLWGVSRMIDGGATCPPFNAAQRCCVAVNSWLLFYFLFVFTPPDQIYCVISSSTTSKLAHHCQGGNKLEQSLIASRVNGRKWVGCGRKPHIPANCTNAQEANCQFDGMFSLSNWSWANWKNRQKPDRGGGVWEIASFEVGDWPFVDGKSLQAIGGRKGGVKKTKWHTESSSLPCITQGWISYCTFCLL